MNDLTIIRKEVLKLYANKKREVRVTWYGTLTQEEHKRWHKESKFIENVANRIDITQEIDDLDIDNAWDDELCDGVNALLLIGDLIDDKLTNALRLPNNMIFNVKFISNENNKI